MSSAAPALATSQPVASPTARAVHIAGPVVAATALCGALTAGWMNDASIHQPVRWHHVITVAVVAVLLAASLWRRVRFRAASARVQRVSFWYRHELAFRDIALSLSLVAALYTTFAATGGLHSPLYPLLYGAVAFAVTVLSRTASMTVLGAAFTLEASVVHRSLQPNAGIGANADVWLTTALHAFFLVSATLLHYVLLRALVVRYRRRQAQRLHEVMHEKEQAARDLRLISTALGPASRTSRNRSEEEQLLSHAGTDAIRDSAGWILRMVKRDLAARTVCWLWYDSTRERVRIGDVVSDLPDQLTDIRALGLVAVILRDGQPVVVPTTKPGQIPYYARDEVPAAFCAVPVREGPHLRGMLCVDRERAFSAVDVAVLESAASQLQRTVMAEQVFRAVERSKYEFERFYQAAAMLGQALTPEQVHETAFDAAAAIANYDAAIITLYDRERGKHRIAAVRIREGGSELLDADALMGTEFRDNTGLAAMAVKNKHYLPASGEPREASTPVFTKKHLFAEAKSLLVLPLVCGDDALGTLTLLARGERRFSKDVREMLSVITTQVATSMVNGMLYKRMETMATTDGLTGLTNHRTFQEKFGELMERARRHGHKVSVMLCDVDFFKKVNDNYGHPVGDEVLRRVARTMQEVARKIDVTARYGGEEFAILLEAVDAEMARSVAERLRQEVAKLVIETDKGPLRVTMSIGISNYPDDASERAEMIERADLALYHAKHTGRNRVVTYEQHLQEKRGAARRAS